MNEILRHLARHGYSVLFASVFARQICLPVPAILFLLAGGAMAGNGRLNLALVIGLGVTGCVLADLVWFEAGRRVATMSCTSFTGFRQILTPMRRVPSGFLTRRGSEALWLHSVQLADNLGCESRQVRHRYFGHYSFSRSVYRFHHLGSLTRFTYDLPRSG